MVFYSILGHFRIVDMLYILASSRLAILTYLAIYLFSVI